mgnify:CR=1 FL=1
MKAHCSSCCRPMRYSVEYCDDCHGERVKRLISCDGWLAMAEDRPGDLPGENLADTFRRDLEGLGKSV